MEGSERAEFRCVDTIRINKLDANDSGFRDFPHDIGQKPLEFWRARQESGLRTPFADYCLKNLGVLKLGAAY